MEYYLNIFNPLLINHICVHIYVFDLNNENDESKFISFDSNL